MDDRVTHALTHWNQEMQSKKGRIVIRLSSMVRLFGSE